MTKKHEELVEEITEIWKPWGGPGGYYPDWVKLQRAKATITLILSAVRDGRLEIPGEVGRYSERKKGETGAMWQMDMYLVENAREFIALREEEEK